MAIGVGQLVVCAPYGIGRVDRTQAALVDQRPTPCFVVKIQVAGLIIEPRGEGQFSLGDIGPDFEAVVPMDAAERVLRPLVTEAEARAVLDRVQPTEDPAFRAASFPERLHRMDHALRAQTLLERANLLSRTLGLALAGAEPCLSFGERKAVHAIERLVVGEIALALGEPADDLAERVRRRFRPS